jgi:hypothetical protein
MTDDYASETLAISAALKRHPDAVVSRTEFPTRERFDAFMACAATCQDVA